MRGGRDGGRNCRLRGDRCASQDCWAFFIDPDSEGAGIGRALHTRMLGWAQEMGIGHLSLSTEEGSRAVQFYSRAGWARAGTSADGEALFEKSLLS
ncbi:MAG: GNAT family N-acetyltransferase [Sphingomonas sp.]|nr:GNAT family N-acetyltransferase [Sphingomonas sp.]